MREPGYYWVRSKKYPGRGWQPGECVKETGWYTSGDDYLYEDAEFESDFDIGPRLEPPA